MGDAAMAAAGSSKLLELDKKDVEAVRSFLPGKILGRTAALLALLVLVLGFAGSLDVGLERFLGFPLEPPWLKYAVLIGLPVLIVGAQILAEWIAERKRKQAQALAVKVDAVPEGYFRIGPYLDTAEDRAKFDRADRIHEKVLAWIKRADATPLYLTGDSGSGKSSVLSAFALPELREAGWTVVEARAWQDPETALSEAIKKLAEAKKWRPGEAKTLRGLLEALAKRADENLLLVLDQFEEFFILAGSERQKAFTAFLDDLRAKPIKGLKLLLVLRSDYKTAIDELGLPLLRQGENWQEVGRFTIAAGAKFMTRSGLALQPDALDRIATSASELDDSPGMIRPITLNVVGHVLSQGCASAPSLDAGLLVRRYIEQSVEQPAIREMSPRVLRELVTEQGTKRPRSEQELVEQTRLRPGEVRAVMNGLCAAALARPLDSAQGIWELSHDSVARAVARYLGRRHPDWLDLARAFAAPALFGLMAAGMAGAIIWNVNSIFRVRAQLAELAIEVTPSGSGGLAAEWGHGFRAESLSEVCRLLAQLPALQTLNLDGTEVVNIGPLKDLRALKVLVLSRTPLADIGPLKDLKALEDLDLRNTRVADIGPLKDLKALRTLYLWNTKVADIGPLKDLKELQTLNLWGTPLADIRPLKDLKALEDLNLLSTQLADIGPLKDLKALKDLDLSDVQVANIGPLKDLNALEYLDLSDSHVADIGPLKDLRELRRLDLSRTKVADIGPLKDLRQLQWLHLSGTKVADVRPLKDLEALETIDVSRTQVVDAGPIQDLPHLSRLAGVSNGDIAKVNAYRVQRGLPTLSN
jgi:Leucine-rich repeat (LRR) protein